MQRKKQLSLILGTGALALLANAPFAQTSSSNDQAVSPSATTSVDANTRFKAMPHSTVTVSPNATTNQNTSTNQSTSTTGVTGSTGTATKGGTGSTDSGSTRAGAGSTGMASAGSSSGSRTGGDAVASGSASSNMATDRNANSPGKGWAKGRDKHDKDLDAHDDQDSGKSSSRR